MGIPDTPPDPSPADHLPRPGDTLRGGRRDDRRPVRPSVTQRVLLFTGDGAMGYQIGELATPARLGLQVIVVVLNNSSLGAVHIWPGMPEELEIGHIDFAEAARACGCSGLRVSHAGELSAPLDEAFACSGPVVVDVMTDRDEWSPLSFAETGGADRPFRVGVKR